MPDASQADLHAEARSRAHADRTDRLLSASAGIVAISALVVSVYQAYITRQQQKLGVWPYMTQANSNADGGYHRMVHNAGVGPALVRSMRLTVDGRPANEWRDVARIMFGDAAEAVVRQDSAQWTTSTFGRGSVLLPGASLTLISVRGRRVPQLLFDVLGNDARAVSTVCYCSLYGDCWTAASNETEPRRVGGCEVDERTEFRD